MPEELRPYDLIEVRLTEEGREFLQEGFDEDLPEAGDWTEFQFWDFMERMVHYGELVSPPMFTVLRKKADK